MMLYVIIGHDIPQSLEKRLAVQSLHRARLEQLQREGRLLLAGPFPTIDTANPGPAGFVGSLIVAEFDDLHHARDWAQADPYATTGVYSHIDIKPFARVFPT